MKESIGSPERLSAAIAYYRAMFDPSTHLDVYESAQQAAHRRPAQPTLYFHGADDGCMGVGGDVGAGGSCYPRDPRPWWLQAPVISCTWSVPPRFTPICCGSSRRDGRRSLSVQASSSE